MAFNPENFVSNGARGNGSAIFNYNSADDALSAISASGYFDAAAEPAGYGLQDGDYILARGSDGSAWLDIAVDASGIVSVNSSVAFS